MDQLREEAQANRFGRSRQQSPYEHRRRDEPLTGRKRTETRPVITIEDSPPQKPQRSPSPSTNHDAHVDSRGPSVRGRDIELEEWF